MRNFAIAQMGDLHSIGWSNGVHSVKTGEKAFDAASVWEHLAQHPEEAQIILQSMSSMGTESAQAVAASHDFSGTKTIVDVGGAQGSLISTIVRSHLHLKGILFDLPDSRLTLMIPKTNLPAGSQAPRWLQKSSTHGMRSPTWRRLHNVVEKFLMLL
jgi:hypothetical protein